MFWKKNKDGVPKDIFGISYDLDRRNYFRVQPGSDKPVFFVIEKKRVPVLDLSAGGLAIEYQATLKPGQQVAGIIILSRTTPPVPVVTQVVKILGNSATALQFVKIKEEGREAIHQYVLERQKEDIKKQREERLKQT